MLGVLGKRAIDLGVLCLACYALAFVPLGRLTGLQHIRAILGTRAARDAGHEIAGATRKLGDRLIGSPEHNTSPPAEPSERSEPAGRREGGGAREARARGADAPPVRGAPVLPKLPKRSAPPSAALAVNVNAPDASL